MGFPKGALSHWVQWVRFALQNCLSRGNHVEFSSVSFFSRQVVRSVTTEVVTLRDNSNDYFATHSGWLGYSRKTKWELVIRDKTFLIWYKSHCRHSFCFALSRIHKKILASVYERSYESSILPPEKPLLKILAARWFLLSWAFAFKNTSEASS